MDYIKKQIYIIKQATENIKIYLDSHQEAKHDYNRSQLKLL